MHGDCGKKSSEFHTFFCHARCSETETSLKKFHIVEKDAVRFRVKLMVEFEFVFESFSILYIQHVVLHIKV
jgi:hypothetical protein